MKVKLSFGNRIRNWFTRRAVEIVDSWDGSASNYDSTEAYCSACLIDVTPSGEAKSQAYCKLPVKAPGSNKYADKGIVAAAGGQGLSAVKKPSDVDQGTWDAAVTKAAKTIVSVYKDMEKDPPSSMMDLAGIARAVSVDSIFQQLQCAMMDGMEMWDSYGSELGYLVTVYIDNGELYALFNKEGLLKRALLTLGDNDIVTLGTVEDVSQQFTPTQRSRVTVIRQADNNYRVFMLAATALVNKEGQIDSTLLFDDMIRRAEDYDYWPTIDFFHLGEENEGFEFGQVDWLGREGVCYLASGVLYGDHPLTPFVVRALQEKGEAWGNSIEYFPIPDSVDYISIGNLEIPVFTQGLNTRISILPSDESCSWFTMTGLEQRAMNKRQQEALKKLLGEEEYNKRMSAIEGINGEVDKNKLIFRATSTPVAEAVVTEPVAEDKPAVTEDKPVEITAEVLSTVTPELEVDEEMVEALAVAVTENDTFAATITALIDKLTTLVADFAKAQGNLTTLQTAVTRMDRRLQTLESEEEVQVQVLKTDVPRRVSDPKMRMTYRPRTQYAVVNEDEPEDYEAIANKTLERIPSVGNYK